MTNPQTAPHAPEAGEGARTCAYVFPHPPAHLPVTCHLPRSSSIHDVGRFSESHAFVPDDIAESVDFSLSLASEHVASVVRHRSTPAVSEQRTGEGETMSFPVRIEMEGPHQPTPFDWDDARAAAPSERGEESALREAASRVIETWENDERTVQEFNTALHGLRRALTSQGGEG